LNLLYLPMVQVYGCKNAIKNHNKFAISGGAVGCLLRGRVTCQVRWFTWYWVYDLALHPRKYLDEKAVNKYRRKSNLATKRILEGIEISNG